MEPIRYCRKIVEAYIGDEVDGFCGKRLRGHDRASIGADGIAILECARKAIAVTSSAHQIQFEPSPEDEPQQRRPDISKAKRLLEWEPKEDLEGGFKLSPEYFRKAMVEAKEQST